MVNDTTTLNGALAELGETMAANLTQQGVTSSASEGLTTLAGKILDIQTGGGSCYHIEFSEDSYVATGGSATLEIMLQENYAPKSGATVTVTGSDSSLYTGITNNDGVAQVTVNNVSGTVTFTGSYSNVSAQCTVTEDTYIINDDASADNTSTLFASSIPLRNSGTGSVAYNSGHYYVITNTKNSAEAFIELKALQGIYNRSFKVTTRTKNTTTDRCSICLYYYLDDNNWGGVKDEVAYVWTSAKTNGTFTENSITTGNSNNVEVVSEFIFDVDENTLTVNDYVGSVLKGTKSMTIPVTLTSSVKWGTTTSWARNTSRNLYEIKAEYI